MKIMPIKKAVNTLGPVEVKAKSMLSPRMVILLWGLAACGKSTFAATAPGDKLWLTFGDNEHASIAYRDDVRVAELYKLGITELFDLAQNTDDPLKLDWYLSQNENIQTVVCDSLTAVSYRALQKAVASGLGRGSNFIPTMEAPGLGAYAGRNAIVLTVIQGLMRVTAKHNVHLIVTAHEDDPVRNNDSAILYSTLMLGGKLVSHMSSRFSEIWHMSHSNSKETKRVIYVQPSGHLRPMKTRMFARDVTSFTLDYDADKPDKGQMTIASWHKQWLDNNLKKIPLPGREG